MEIRLLHDTLVPVSHIGSPQRKLQQGSDTTHTNSTMLASPASEALDLLNQDADKVQRAEFCAMGVVPSNGNKTSLAGEAWQADRPKLQWWPASMVPWPTLITGQGEGHPIKFTRVQLQGCARGSHIASQYCCIPSSGLFTKRTCVPAQPRQCCTCRSTGLQPVC